MTFQMQPLLAPYNGVVQVWHIHPREKIRGDTIEQWKVGCRQLGQIHVLHG